MSCVKMQSSVLYYGYFPQIETEKNWEEGKTTEEKQQDWDDYFDTYANTCRLNLVLIGLGLRAIALFCLRFWAEICIVYRVVATWMDDAMMKVYGISKHTARDVLRQVKVIKKKDPRREDEPADNGASGMAT